MKTLLALFAILISFAASAQSIEINANGGTANASAILDLKSTTKGFLLPRMTNAQMRDIPSPAQGLLAFCTDCGTNGDYYFYKGTAWVALGSTTVGTIASATPNGASITNGVLSLAPADATNPGIVTTTAQTIAGVKTFSADLTVNGLTIGTGKAGISTNTAIGLGALSLNTTGNSNTSIGYRSLFLNTTGSQNTANGYQALYSNTTGFNNIANGYQALYLNTIGSQNTATGIEALYSNIGGSSNTANGYQALKSNTTGILNTATGHQALYSNISGSYNTSTGSFALLNNTTGIENTANGRDALSSNTTGSNNTATGSQALYSNKIGSFNTATGYQALLNNTANSNTAIGHIALSSNITGSNNTANGFAALGRNTTGKQNTSTGFQALRMNTTGDYNTANGVNTLLSNLIGSNNTAIGYGADVSFDNLSNATAIGANASVNASNKIQMGDGNVTAVQLGTGTNVTLETGLVKITGGTPGEGKVLTSDAAGLASWTSPTPAQQVLTGSITSFAGANLPPSSGYLICDGSAVSRTTYANLFLVIGTTYGSGDGTTTFNLPDLRGRTIIGTGQGIALTNRTLASTGGEEAHTLSVNEMPSHNHSITDPGHNHLFSKNLEVTRTSSNGNDYVTKMSFANISTSTATTDISIDNSGGGQAHNTMSPYISLNYIIKY